MFGKAHGVRFLVSMTTSSVIVILPVVTTVSTVSTDDSIEHVTSLDDAFTSPNPLLHISIWPHAKFWWKKQRAACGSWKHPRPASCEWSGDDASVGRPHLMSTYRYFTRLVDGELVKVRPTTNIIAGHEHSLARYSVREACQMRRATGVMILLGALMISSTAPLHPDGKTWGLVCGVRDSITR
jgi:hypothetical protein